MSAACSNCGVRVDDEDAPCPVCAESSPAAKGSASGLERMVAASAYFTFIPAGICLLLPRFKHNQFVRFHAFQSIFLFVAAVLSAGILKVFFLVFAAFPFLISGLFVTIMGLGCFFLWVVVLVKALQGKRFKLPWIGSLAENQAQN